MYEGALRAAVLRLKHEPHLPTRLKAALAFALQRRSFAQTTKIIPVPLSKERLRERGFNQASVLGKQLSQLTGLPLDEHSLERTEQTIGHRAGMDAPRRRESVAGAFTATRPRLLEKQRILLVDDVFTTGATVSSCTTELLEAGAVEVCVLTLARVR
jgi:ComF family protein